MIRSLVIAGYLVFACPYLIEKEHYFTMGVLLVIAFIFLPANEG